VIGVVTIFMALTGIGMITGLWQNKITPEEYMIHYKLMNSYGHPTGTKEMKHLNEQVTRERLNEKSKKVTNN
jgi:hypothetical protein